MGIQILLLLGVVLFLWISIRAGAGSYRVLRALGAVTILTATILSLMKPNLWQEFAIRLGVGRGADLVLYLLIPTFLVFVALTFARIRQVERKHAELVRQFAVQTALDSTRQKLSQVDRTSKP